MPTVTTPIIPHKTTLVKTSPQGTLDHKAICVFAATGFFLDQDTWHTHQKMLSPASLAVVENGMVQKQTPYFQWHYTPKGISFEEALEEYTHIFEQILSEQTQGEQVILPISGGLDSRTQALGLERIGAKVQGYSYDFKGGYPETKIAKKIAKACGFPFQELHVEAGYLWDKIEALATMNQCYSEFTHPRQMAFTEAYTSMGTVFSLGHWGDVLFDRGAPKGTTLEDLPQLALKKIVKKGGWELGNKLWEVWGLEGNFKEYLTQRTHDLLKQIGIDNASAKMRAFKSLYWAPRWTSVNLSVFESVHPITLPYYDNRMCEFICTIPEEYLADRKLQIAYLKKYSPTLSKITWQAQKPYNLYTFPKNKSPQNLPYRVIQKAKREAKKAIGKPYIQRNWELQFEGMENDAHLQEYLFSEELLGLVPKETVTRFYNAFKNIDAVEYSHPVSMLLTFALRMKLFEHDT